LLLKFCFRLKFFDFRVLALSAYPVRGAGLLDFPQLLLKPCTGSPLRRSCKCCLGGKFLRWTLPQSGALISRVLRVSRALINFLCKTNGKYLALSLGLRQGKLTTLRCEKFDTKMKFKANERLHKV
jgi:hypothetical protein